MRVCIADMCILPPRYNTMYIASNHTLAKMKNLVEPD